MTRRGFTLIEAMVALAIASALIAGATGAVIQINKQVADNGRRAQAWDESKRLEEYLIARAQGAGGGQIRPQSSILVEDAQVGAAVTLPFVDAYECRAITGIPACATNGQDRLTVIKQHPGLGECSILSVAGSVLTVADDPPGTCCLDTVTAPATFTGAQALVVSQAGVTSVRMPTAHAGCVVTVQTPGQAGSLLPDSLATVTGTLPAFVIGVTAETFYVESNQLKRWEDIDADGVADAAEIRIVHDRVYGQQFALGFDGLPEDGRVVDGASTSDEWLFNVASDPLPGAGAWNAVATNQTRMLRVALAVGAPTQINGGGNVVRLLNHAAGVSAANVFLAESRSDAYLRNLNLFTQ